LDFDDSNLDTPYHYKDLSGEFHQFKLMALLIRFLTNLAKQFSSYKKPEAPQNGKVYICRFKTGCF
jgi:DNA mismatch repair protein MutL